MLLLVLKLHICQDGLLFGSKMSTRLARIKCRVQIQGLLVILNNLIVTLTAGGLFLFFESDRLWLCRTASLIQHSMLLPYQ